VFVGSDAMGSVATFAGAFHDELRFQVEAGASAGEVLYAATGRAARFLDDNAGFGTIEPGKAADLVLVRGNPLDDISATRDIDRVVVAGASIRRTPAGR
jgi:imidazolonepropionase-like amidohydrolase